ncbi:undecaprenyl phosphate translocase family protein [Tissierella sp.]|uniref:DUF368 domain-containing protein n=1 Tax=Tissierella sp. TaxID=41274 RepID=UPI0028657D27|nr:DUF368 domain-containing protein [Tissierella sp.]MDR7856964.1 DUF368 domain-containing protein [Tissierella sp.]
MDFFKDFIKGIIIGIGAIAPGVSGGAFAVMFGVYDKITDAIANVFKNFKKKVFILLPLGLGACVGILGFSNIMKYLFEQHEPQVKFLFIGLMLGALPSVIKEANRDGFKKQFLLPCLIAFSITSLFSIWRNSSSNIIPVDNTSLFALIIYGVIIGFGTIIPGISSSFILMYIGAYEIVLDGIANIDLIILIPMGIGFVLSILLFARIINFLFKKIYGYTYYAILGFVGGSIITILPQIEFTLEYLLSMVIFLIGFYLSHGFSKWA